ncbi:MAG: ABC transporter ATP-binding protein [Deltaproteobacteria bacterium]|nr:ABC transporter ATP-binding protein [Deltaproteobacteria bacterium]
MTLALCGACFGYPGRPVGRDVDLELQPGEVLALLGPNGGGKTTLFLALLGLLRLDGGQALLEGAPLERLSRRDIARRVAYVPQGETGFFPFAVLDAVLLGRAPHLGPFAAPAAADRCLAGEVLTRLGIAHLAERPCTRLSGGEAALVRIARALVQQPIYLVLDEPTASLDYGNRLRVLDLLAGLARSGLGVLLSTHDPGQAAGWADRVALLQEGQLLATGPPEAILTVAALRQLFGVEVVAVEVPGVRGRLFAPRAGGG